MYNIIYIRLTVILKDSFNIKQKCTYIAFKLMKVPLGKWYQFFKTHYSVVDFTTYTCIITCFHIFIRRIDASQEVIYHSL